jgi:hypothetical protein
MSLRLLLLMMVGAGVAHAESPLPTFTERPVNPWPTSLAETATIEPRLRVLREVGDEVWQKAARYESNMPILVPASILDERAVISPSTDVDHKLIVKTPDVGPAPDAIRPFPTSPTDLIGRKSDREKLIRNLSGGGPASDVPPVPKRGQ